MSETPTTLESDGPKLRQLTHLEWVARNRDLAESIRTYGEVQCDRCDGTCEITCECPECGNEHEVRCPKCEGSGTVPATDTMIAVEMRKLYELQKRSDDAALKAWEAANAAVRV